MSDLQLLSALTNTQQNILPLHPSIVASGDQQIPKGQWAADPTALQDKPTPAKAPPALAFTAFPNPDTAHGKYLPYRPIPSKIPLLPLFKNIPRLLPWWLLEHPIQIRGAGEFAKLSEEAAEIMRGREGKREQGLT